MSESETEQIKEMRLEILNDIKDNRQDEIFKLKLKRAKMRYLSLVYPYDRSITELPDERAKDWQIKCAIELYKLEGDENVTSYSENGLSETYAKAGLSEGLLSELPPARAGVIK